MQPVNRIAFRFVRRYWVGWKTPADMVVAFTLANLGMSEGHQLCRIIARRHLFRKTVRPFLQSITRSHK